ncbi:unnamed protein product [Camellia sinensis]
MCPFCKAEVETGSHVLIHCPRVWKVWSNLPDWWVISWVTPANVEGLMNWWMGVKFNKLELQIWKLLPFAMLWATWKVRNECVFNGLNPNFAEVEEIVKVRVAMWAKSSLKGVRFSIHDMVSNIREVKFCL